MMQVVVDVVDYNPETSVELVTVYDSRRQNIRPDTLHWTVDEDMIDFPVVSQLTYLTVRWRMSGISSGRLAFVLRSSERRLKICPSVCLSHSIDGRTVCPCPTATGGVGAYRFAARYQVFFSYVS